MKKLTTAVILLLIICLCFTGCGKESVTIDGESVIIVVSSDVCEITSETTLLDYMEALAEDGDLSYVESSGMIISIGDVEPSFADNKFWGLYTDDADMANTAWGEFEYDGAKYGSAIVGAGELIVSEGTTYIWNVTSF